MPVQTSYYQFGSWNREILHNLFLLLLLFSFLALSCWAYAFIEFHCTAKTWRVLVWATCWSSLSASRQCKIIYIMKFHWKKKKKLNKNCLCLCLPFPCYYVSVVSGGTCSFWRKELKYDEKNTLLYQRCVGFFFFLLLTHPDVMTVTQNSLNLKNSVGFMGWKTILYQSNRETGLVHSWVEWDFPCCGLQPHVMWTQPSNRGGCQDNGASFSHACVPHCWQIKGSNRYLPTKRQL